MTQEGVGGAPPSAQSKEQGPTLGGGPGESKAAKLGRPGKSALGAGASRRRLLSVQAPRVVSSGGRGKPQGAARVGPGSS